MARMARRDLGAVDPAVASLTKAVRSTLVDRMKELCAQAHEVRGQANRLNCRFFGINMDGPEAGYAEMDGPEAGYAEDGTCDDVLARTARVLQEAQDCLKELSELVG